MNMAKSSQNRGVRIVAIILVVAMLVSFGSALILALMS